MKQNTGWSWSFKNQAESFVETILSGSESVSSGQDGIEDLKLIEDIWKHIIE